MKSKTKIIIPLVLGILLIVVGFVINSKNNYSDKNSNNKGHRSEFTIIESNYIEKNYERYIEYKKKHSDYSDDKIITYVNIGLDNEFYTNTQNTNEDDGILMIVNKYYSIRSDYVPKLVTHGSFNAQVSEVLVNDFNKMIEVAEKSNIDIFAIQGYLSYEEQNSLYDISVNDNGEEETINTVAKAGYSDYQTGLAIDISGNSEGFIYSKECAWLKNHAYEYGFILRYPEGKEEITGFKYQPWHYRYVGKDVAKIIHDKNLTLEEYYATYVLKDES